MEIVQKHSQFKKIIQILNGWSQQNKNQILSSPLSDFTKKTF